ncbi:MAG: methionyl-tRNA formyltransferase [Dethiobacteria bacterium]
MSDDTLVFLGTAPFALPSLRMLLDRGFDLAGIITRPDRPAGRGKKITFPPVKETALEYNLDIFQPRSKAELLGIIKELRPKIMVSVAYGMILPAEALMVPQLGAINVHPSLLPAYRGAAPIQRALLAGEKSTGVSIFFMSPGMDDGDIILQEKIGIGSGETFGVLYDRLAVLGAEKLYEALELVMEGKAARLAQDDDLATFAPPLSREDERIVWSKGAPEIANQIRALDPYPGAYTIFRGKRLKIWKVDPEKREGSGASPAPGTICRVEKDYFTVATTGGSLRVLELQPEGKKRMAVEDFLKGNRLEAGENFE